MAFKFGGCVWYWTCGLQDLIHLCTCSAGNQQSDFIAHKEVIISNILFNSCQQESIGSALKQARLLCVHISNISNSFLMKNGKTIRLSRLVCRRVIRKLSGPNYFSLWFKSNYHCNYHFQSSLLAILCNMDLINLRDTFD